MQVQLEACYANINTDKKTRYDRTIHSLLLIATGTIHMMYGLLPTNYLSDWQTFFVNGLWKNLELSIERETAACWFVIAGAFIVLFGLVVREIEIIPKHYPYLLEYTYWSLALLERSWRLSQLLASYFFLKLCSTSISDLDPQPKKSILRVPVKKSSSIRQDKDLQIN